ncbi:MAG: DUF1800 domain-containing protein [Marinicella sp.]
MKNKNIPRRQLLAGGMATTLLAALPMTASTSQARSNINGQAKSSRKVGPDLVGSIKAAPLPEQSFAHMVYGRLGYGITPGEFDEASFLALGGDDASRLSQFVDQQLAGGADPELDARIADAGNYETLNKSLTEMWQDYHIGAASQYRPIYEMKRLKFLRATYTLYPLRERIADFWHDHFSLNGDDYYARSTMTSWDRDVIRGHMIGNFHDFLLATAQHPAMLYYLDNWSNSDSEPNENYAREMIELHTLGVENYYGLGLQSEPNLIPVTESGGPWPASGMIQEKYVDNDVYEATRCLTGWHVNDSTSKGDTGEFFYDDDRHDRFQKSFLAGGFVNIPANQQVQDGYDVIEMLAYHPGTAKHIAGKLARFFISDEPPQSVIDDVAAVFYDNRTASNQLELVFKALFNHADFADPTHWQTKLKRPFDSVVSAMRVCEADFTVMPDDSDSNSMEYRMDDTGHYPFEWQAPDGYPSRSNYWMSSTALIQTWKTVDWMIDERDSSDEYRFPIRVRTVNEFQSIQSQLTPENMLSFWMTEIFDTTPSGGWIGDTVFESIIGFLVQQPEDGSFPPWHRSLTIPFEDLEENSWPYRWHERLRGMVSLILASPYFMQR